MSKQVYVVLPAFREAARIGAVIEALRSHVPTAKTVVVDDGSPDDTARQAQQAGATYVVKLKMNLGKGGAARTGCRIALAKGATHIVLMDSDGQHRAEDVAGLLRALDEGADLAIGARKREGEMPLVMRLGNGVLTRITSLLTGLRVMDSQSGFRAFRAEVYPRIAWESSSYGMESEMLAAAGHAKLVTADVPIPTVYLDAHKGTTPLDGLRVLGALVSWKLRCSLGFK